jgi:hexokinase
MGKGFAAAAGVLGEDIGDLIMGACKKRVSSTTGRKISLTRQGMDVRIEAIVNDGSATLLSSAYTDRTTRFGLILGTGTNMSVLLPVTALSAAKFADRPRSWHERRAADVVVNTEFSMFGGAGLLPATRWDERLRRAHPAPDFQPFEMLVGGRCLGEIVRLMMVEAVATAGLFGGEVPTGLDEPYGLDTGTLAAIDGCVSPFPTSLRFPLETPFVNHVPFQSGTESSQQP